MLIERLTKQIFQAKGLEGWEDNMKIATAKMRIPREGVKGLGQDRKLWKVKTLSTP